MELKGDPTNLEMIYRTARARRRLATARETASNVYCQFALDELEKELDHIEKLLTLTDPGDALGDFDDDLDAERQVS